LSGALGVVVTLQNNRPDRIVVEGISATVEAALHLLKETSLYGHINYSSLRLY
jgi:hypothetical protein